MLDVFQLSFEYTYYFGNLWCCNVEGKTIKPATKPSLLFWEFKKKQKLRFEIIIVYLNNELHCNDRCDYNRGIIWLCLISGNICVQYHSIE